jgi:hypothetical protein
MTADGGTTPTNVSVNSHVTASDDANVGQQVGAQFVSSVMHDTKIYNTVSGDPPERRHEVARAHLDGGNPRRAEEAFGRLLAERHITTERAYLYVLSVLSDRSFTEITTRLSDEIHNAMKLAAELPKDSWREALDVVNALLRYAHAEFSDGTLAREFTAAWAAFGALSADRQDEIDRHLNLILSGAVRERLTSERKHEVAVERMSGDRVGRAWKFFEAHPREPMEWPAAAVRSDAADWRAAILGCVAVALAILYLLTGGITVDGVPGLVLIAAGGYLVLRGTTVLQAHTRHAQIARSNFQRPSELRETEFDKLVDQCFRERAPGCLGESTVGYRRYLKRRLQTQYGSEGCYPGELKWLIAWHADRSGHQHDHRAEPPEVRRAAGFRIGGVLAGLVGLILLLTTGHAIALVIAAGGWWAVRGIAGIAAAPRTQVLLDDAAEALLAEEQVEYRRWAQILADRPKDTEMARWLALDKAYLRNNALRRANLRERDLVTHVVLTERAPFARKGRVTDGPPRYEKYIVYVFLLTHYGMRTVRTHLSLATGGVGDEQRQMFPYDAVASASVDETGGRTLLADGCLLDENLRRRVFRLTLLNGTIIAEVKENPRTVDDDRAVDGDELVDAVSTQTSGFDSALRILEAVATEGRDWIIRDRERKQRWARNWQT